VLALIAIREAGTGDDFEVPERRKDLPRAADFDL
jgi:hypothetical protein